MCDNREKTIKLKMKLTVMFVLLFMYTTSCVNDDLSTMENNNTITEDNSIEVPVNNEQDIEVGTIESADDQKTEEINHYGKGSFQTNKEQKVEDVLINALSEVQRNLILNFMTDYYDMLATLKFIDPSDYFVYPEGRDAVLNKAAWTVFLELRDKQDIDLKMEEYEFVLTLENIEIEGDDLRITLTEDSVQKFKAYPNVQSQQYNTIHYFILSHVSQGWRIERHYQRGTLYWKLLGDNHKRSDEEDKLEIDEQEIIESIYTQMNVLLEKADGNMMMRQETIEKVDALDYDYAYNRRAAIEYADSWINRRNETWLDYSSYGGNCQNFASQMLLASGIPMDLKGNELWKWYGTTPNNNTSSTGRTSSWTGVDEFLDYAMNNEGFGLVADTNVPYYSGEIGDLIIMGYDENWRHTVVISEVIKDDSGQTIDYLIHSNTSDLKNFPVSAYMYTHQKLIKILGWND